MIDVETCKYDENYLVFSTGDVYNGNLEKMKPYHTNGSSSPYLYYMFKDPEKRWKSQQKKVYIHRLVAEHFLENPNNLRDVHHIDNNPHNNDVSNLQWLSHKDNCRMKPQLDPKEKISSNPNQYIFSNKKDGKFVFRWSGSNPKYPKKNKTFDKLNEAREYRDNYFAVA